MALVWKIALILVFVHFVVSQTGNRCGEPPKYPDKQLDNKYLYRPVFNHHDKVSYKCDRGHVPSAGSRISFCKRGLWTPLTLKCQKIKCYGLADIENGQYKQEGQSYRDKAIVVCNKGYVLSGVKFRVCLQNGWSGTDPVCVAPIVTCSAPAVENRLIKPGERPQYTPLDTLSITCIEGFDLIGSSVVTCGPDGQWHDLPECHHKVPKMICSAPAVENRWIKSGERTQYTPQDTVSIACNEGFDLIGSSVVTCGPDGQWQDLPKCHRKVTLCSAPAVANRRINEFGKQYQPKDTVSITCSEGFDLIGSPQVTCGPDGQWQGLPECRPKRLLVNGKCGPPPFYHNVFFRDGSPSLTEYSSGARIRYKCNLGHRRASGSDIIHCQGGQWTKLALRCQRKSCGSAGEISFGRFEYSGVSFGDSATAVCQEGYELIGPEVRVCRDGGWDGRVPVCEPVHCPPPPEVRDAEVSDFRNEDVPVGHMVSYSCQTGALIGARDLHCTPNGTWSSPAPLCKDISCPQPHVPHGSRMRGFRSVYKYGNTITIACSPGLRLYGESFVTCGADGNWTPKLPECRR